MKCDTCNKEYSPDCDYRQGRCPHHEPLIDIPIWRAVIYFIAAPIFIGVWCLLNPRKVWKQAKEDWNLK